MRSGAKFALLAAVIAGAGALCFSQTAPELQKFLQDNIGLNQNQIAAIRSGKPVTKAMPARTPGEVFLFGAVYVHAAPESYVKFASDFDRLRKLPGYLAIKEFSNPPQLSDLDGFSLDSDDVKALQNCKPGDCLVQMPAGAIGGLQQSVNWSAPDADQQVNQFVHAAILKRLLSYEQQGNQALGVYNDKRDPTEVPKQFAYMLSYDKVLPQYLPDFFQYLLDYPKDKPANVEDKFYWASVKFGLKPTLRVVQVLTMRGNAATGPAYVIAEKQLYSSHYFETALDLTFCIRGDNDTGQPGFYLLMAMGSEQAGLTGVKGSIVRKVAVDRSVSSLRDALATIKTTLENNQ